VFCDGTENLEYFMYDEHRIEIIFSFEVTSRVQETFLHETQNFKAGRTASRRKEKYVLGRTNYLLRFVTTRTT
jgi:hypothetical protein